MPPKKRVQVDNICQTDFSEARRPFVLIHVQFASEVCKKIGRQLGISIIELCRPLYPFKDKPADEPKNDQEKIEQIKLMNQLYQSIERIKSQMIGKIFRNGEDMFFQFEKAVKDFIIQYYSQHVLLHTQPNIPFYFSLLKQSASERNAFKAALLFQQLFNQFNPNGDPPPLKGEKESLMTLSSVLPTLFQWHDEHSQRIEDGIKEALAASVGDMLSEIEQLEEEERDFTPPLF